jgi:hypothetical protein
MSLATYQITTTSVSTVYTSSGNSAITTAYLCNTSNSPVTANVYVVPSGGTANVANQIYSQLTIAGYDTYVMEWERILLNNGDTVQIKAGTGSVLTVTTSFTGI